jgi:SAM-dependent methyltransferase
MNQDVIREAVRDRYGRIAENAEESCCGPSCCGGTSETSAETSASTKVGYDEEQLGRIPEGADLGLGSGNPVAHADLREGDTVLDLGSGGGIDSFLASERVGATGKVIGVDMTPEMVTRARANALKGGYTNVDFRLGEIEALPVADATVDVIISNCVLNLSPERDRVLTEALRVLKSGGRLVISDLVCDVPVPAQLLEEAEAVTACLPVEREPYESQLRAAGFIDVRISAGRPYPHDAACEAPIGERIAADPELAAAVDAFADSVRGVIIEGKKAD